MQCARNSNLIFYCCVGECQSLLKSILCMFLHQLYEMEVLNGASEFGMYASLVESSIYEMEVLNAWG